MYTHRIVLEIWSATLWSEIQSETRLVAESGNQSVVLLAVESENSSAAQSVVA